MSNLLTGISNIRLHLLKPKEGAPSIDTRIRGLKIEQQNFFNKLNNSSVMWTTQDFTITPNGQDVLIPREIGKVWFVRTGLPYNSIPLDFTDLRDASTDWWWYQPIAASRPQDYGFGYGVSSKIAFYYRDGLPYAKIPLPYLNLPLIITAAQGLWEPNLATEGVLREYSHLPEIKTSRNFVEDCEWDGFSEERSDRRKSRLLQTLSLQISEIDAELDIAKRSITAETIVYGSEPSYF